MNSGRLELPDLFPQGAQIRVVEGARVVVLGVLASFAAFATAS
jgi:hypothetical protein